jgi:peroxiredoxin
VVDFNQLPPDLPVPENDGAADHLPGRSVPPLTLPATSGQRVALDQLGAGRTVLYVYPLTGRPDVDLPEGWDNIPGARGCTAEACDFRDHHHDLLAAGAARVFGLSSQDSDYQREVVDRLRLPFAMLSDTDLTLAETLGLPTFRAGGMTLFKRLTLVISDGTIEHVFYPVSPPNEHAQLVLAWLRSHPPAERSTHRRGFAPQQTGRAGRPGEPRR